LLNSISSLFEILDSKRIRVTSLTFQGHVTSSVTVSEIFNGTKINDLDLCLEVVWTLRSCQSLLHIRRWISRKPL